VIITPAVETSLPLVIGQTSPDAVLVEFFEDGILPFFLLSLDNGSQNNHQIYQTMSAHGTVQLRVIIFNKLIQSELIFN
jgi:hypothetical protein